MQRLRETIVEQQRQLEEQQRALDEQRQQIDRILRENETALPPEELSDTRAAGQTAPQTLPETSATVPPPTPSPTVREAAAAERAALPEFASVLTSQGHFVIEPSLEYINVSSNRLVFRGIEIVTGLQIGVIEASDVDRDTLLGALTARYGVTDRIEVEFRAPYLYRHDRVTTLAQRDEQIIREFNLEGQGIGDVEASLRYQFNDDPVGPIYIANLRVKSNTGTNPFEIERDEFGILEELPTGSGFWAIEPSVTVILTSDPVVLYGNLSYMAHLERDIDEVIGDVLIGTVDPGDSIGASLGFGFALNRRFSFSMGYKHNYIYETETEFGPTVQSSEALQVGSFLMGMSYRINSHTSANANFEFGVTGDAPNARLVFRMPYLF